MFNPSHKSENTADPVADPPPPIRERLPNEFIAIDVETANADVSSICQIGLAHFRDGAVIDEWKTYVDPEDEFDPINVWIHGITERMVRGAPTFPKVINRLCEFVSQRITVCHTHFDRVAILNAIEKYALTPPDCLWLDSARVARRTWEHCRWSGYGLGPVCEHIGYEFKAHDALEDAKAAGQILLAAIGLTGLAVEDWLKRVKQPIDGSSYDKSIRRDGNPDGVLFGEMIVFTGALSMVRAEAADLAAQVGCSVGSGVTKKTTLLVVGDQDIKKLNGKDKSAKHRKAEDLIAKGQAIRILRESDFRALVALDV
ncbi:MAG: hypothetical protein KDD69_16410 [Bdellovibrionales bacterium]|nr:hypothetical protein [Bdellovibrionales bacterium]